MTYPSPITVDEALARKYGWTENDIEAAKVLASLSLYAVRLPRVQHDAESTETSEASLGPVRVDLNFFRKEFHAEEPALAAYTSALLAMSLGFMRKAALRRGEYAICKTCECSMPLHGEQTCAECRRVEEPKPPVDIAPETISCPDSCPFACTSRNRHRDKPPVNVAIDARSAVPGVTFSAHALSCVDPACSGCRGVAAPATPAPTKSHKGHVCNDCGPWCSDACLHCRGIR